MMNPQFSHQHRRVGIFIDVQNMYYSARNMFASKVNFGNIVKAGINNQQLIRAIAYTISTKTGEELPFFGALHNMGIEVNMKELLEFEGGQKKGDWDVGITMDIVRMLDMLDVVVLVSGDGDYVPLAEYSKNRGRVFHVMSFRESTSSKLVECADIYTNLSDDLNTFLMRDPHYRPQTYQRETNVQTPPIIPVPQPKMPSTSELIQKETATEMQKRRPGRPKKSLSITQA